eukprot:3055750-Prymnesium_polylepis.1
MPKAADVRPLPVLRQAFELVRKKWNDEADYAYACEQLKAIRQDLTVQQYTAAEGQKVGAFTKHVYETHARIALLAADFDEYAQCQSQVSGRER